MDSGTRQGYKLFYRKVSDAGSTIKDPSNKSMVLPANTTEAVVRGLDLYSKYCFQLLVFNEKFDGMRSNPVCAGKEIVCFIFSVTSCWCVSSLGHNFIVRRILLI